MRLKNIFSLLLLGVVALLASCSSDDDITVLKDLQVSKSYVSIPKAGGSDTITIKANSDWKLEHAPEWVTLSDSVGTAGVTDVIFKADAYSYGRSSDAMTITCNGQVQHINIVQGEVTITDATCAEVLAGPDNKTYQVTGTVTAISNTTYGNLYINDGTGEVYIYGTLDKTGAEKNFLSLGIEEGDEITVQGPKQTYNGTVELVNVTVVKINKGMIKVDSLSTTSIPKDGGNVTVYATTKGSGVSFDIPEDAKGWLSLVSVKQNGTAAELTFKAAANEGSARSTTLTLSTVADGKTYSMETTIAQAGGIADVSVAEFNKAADGEDQYRLKGVATNVQSNGSFTLADWSGSTTVYRSTNGVAKGVKNGDIVTVVGTHDTYNGTVELVGGDVTEVVPTTPVSIAEFLGLPDGDTYYMLTGKITKIAEEHYGNVYISDGKNEVYLYGLYPGYGAEGDNRYDFVTNSGLKVGDEITVIGTHTTYNGTIEMKNAIFVSKK